MGQRARITAAAVATIMALAVLSTPALATVTMEETEGGELCTDFASMSWETDITTLTVAGATVEVKGCDDGEPVGLQLITDEGDVPDDGPIMKEAADERAFFDLTDFEQDIEPVTGVRVYLQLADEVEYWEITVERRFFNMPGNEQLGLRQTTVLLVPDGGTYRVPGAPGGYDEVACEDVGVDIDDIDDSLEGDDNGRQGSGEEFTATESGRHLACYQQTPGEPREPIDEEPEIIEDADDPADDTEVGDETGAEDAPSAPVDPDPDTDLDDAASAPDDTDDDATARPEEGPSAREVADATDVLALTGVNVWPPLVAGAMLLGIGTLVIRRTQPR